MGGFSLEQTARAQQSGFDLFPESFVCEDSRGRLQWDSIPVAAGICNVCNWGIRSC